MAWYGRKSASKISENDKIGYHQPFLVLLGNGGAKIYSSIEDEEILNFQRGLASLFILRQENLEIEETDVLGKCLTRYHLDRLGLHKLKEFCQSGPDSQTNDIFNNRKYSTVKSLYKLQQESGIIDSLEVQELVEFYPNLTPEIAQDIQQKQSLTLKGKQKKFLFFKNEPF